MQGKWAVGGAGGWDYLVADSAAHRLYVTHGPRVEVLDAWTTGKAVGAITWVSKELMVWPSTTPANSATSATMVGANVTADWLLIETTCRLSPKTIPTGTNPDGIVFDPFTKTVWAFNGRSKDVTVIDTASRKIIATVALPGKPEFPTSDGKGNIFDNIEDKNVIVRLSAKEPKITATWPLAGCESPSGMAIDIAGHRLFSVCDGKKMAVVDSTSGKVLATPEIGDGPDAAGYDPNTKLAFSSNGEGTLTVVDAGGSSYKVLQTLTTEPRARTMALDSSTGKVYLVTAKFGHAPAATAENPRPRPSVLPDSFTVLVAGHE